MNKPVYVYDELGYYDYEDIAQVDPMNPSSFIVPPNSTELKPEGLQGFVYHWNGKAWDAEKVPTTPAEFEGKVISADLFTAYGILMRETIQKVCENSETHRLQRGEDLSYYVEKIPPKTPEEIEKEAFEKAKQDRAQAVSKIVVTVDGMKFDGDETAQGRMSRTITAAMMTGEQETVKTYWVLADNTVAQVTIEQLARALRLAGEKQTELWTVPYEDEKPKA